MMAAAMRLGCLGELPRAALMSGPTPLEPLPRLAAAAGSRATLWVKRDDCATLAFGGNKVRQLEFYLGAALAEGADTVLITGAVQSNFVRLAAAGARKLGMDCHIQLEERVASTGPNYRQSGNVFLDRLFGATLHTYPEGEDESGADRQVRQIASDLRDAGRRTYVIPLAAGHPPLGALGYVLAAAELLDQLSDNGPDIREIHVGSGSGATHGGLLYGLRALGSQIRVTGICVRRSGTLQQQRILATCRSIAALLGADDCVDESDVQVTDEFLGSGYGVAGDATMAAIVTAARTESLLLDPVYTGKTMAAFIDSAAEAPPGNILFWHTGGIPAIFAYRDLIEEALR